MRNYLVLIAVLGCSEPSEQGAPVVVDMPAIDIAAGQEIESLCQSWTLDNDETLYVNAVHMNVGPGWHHSNWFFVPEDTYAGPDGTWACSDRDFNTLDTALLGGVLYAQSTQATAERQRFEPGAAVVIPPRSKIIGEVHLLNATDQSLSSNIHLELETISAGAFRTSLVPVTLVYFDLDLPPQSRSRFAATCDFAQAYGAPVDLRIHYVLPHYHSLGEGMFLEAVGGPMDGQVIYENASAIGEPLGGALQPPFELTAGQGMRFGCTFDNHGDQSVGWGIGDQEMCVLLAFAESPFKWLGGVEEGSTWMGENDGVNQYEGPCRVLVFPAD